MIDVCILVYYMVSVSYMLYMYQKYRVCPEFIWCALQLLMFFGLAQLIDKSNADDCQLVTLYLLGLIGFIGASVIFQSTHKINGRIYTRAGLDRFNIRKTYLYSIMGLSMLICAWFFVRSGGNVFLNSLRALIRGQEYSTKYARMAMLSVSGVGYVYQLRVIILPVAVLYYAFMKKNCLSTYILAVLMIVFLVGTGQRGGLVSFAAICVISIYYLSAGKRVDEVLERKGSNFKKYVMVFLVVGVLFGLTTVMNGRVGEGSIVAAIIKRFINDNQNSARMGFRYIKTQDIQYGYDWFMQLKDVLPGKNEYVSVSTRIFAYVYGGSTAGTAPPCIWGSTYYNFGAVGVGVMGVILGWGVSRIHYVFSRKVCDEWDVIAYSGLQFLLGYWVAADPMTLLNNGFVAIVLLNFFMKMALRVRIVIGHRRKA